VLQCTYCHSVGYAGVTICVYACANFLSANGHGVANLFAEREREIEREREREREREKEREKEEEKERERK
jgi:hypothetical protein